MQIDGWNAARRSDHRFAVDRHYERRTVVLLGEAASGESDHPFVPVFPGENENTVARLLGYGVSWCSFLRNRVTKQLSNLLFGRSAYLELHRLPLGIHPIKLGAKLPCHFVVLGGEEINRRFGGGEPSRCVDARSDTEADVYRS